jgi:hypothetical protein
VIMPARRFPLPWSVEGFDACSVVTDSAGKKHNNLRKMGENPFEVGLQA